MLSPSQVYTLQRALTKLRESAKLVSYAIGDTDAGDMTCNAIESIISDIEHDLQDA